MEWTLVARALIVAAVATACSYGARFDDCDVRCSGPEDCPEGFTCNGENRCRPEGAGASCAAVLSDANNPATDGSGAGRCTGTAATCAELTAMAACDGQFGCTFMNVCRLTVDCTAITTNQQCENTPGCGTDFTTSSCKPLANYCTGTTTSQCESRTNCRLGGSCSGTAAPCSLRADEAACEAHVGCAWDP